jgi:hypothetical protein
LSEDNIRTIELGFAEYTSILILDVLKAILTANIEQEKQLRDLELLSKASPAFLASTLSDEEIQSEIVRLFPLASDVSGKSSVDAGESYSPGTKDIEENPPLFKTIGYSITPKDVQKNQKGLALTTEGNANIRKQVAFQMANRHLVALNTTLSKGIPRVYVDNGKINTKLTIKLQDSTNSKNSNATSILLPFSKSKIIVSPINGTKPEYLGLRTDIISEVEITFKTVMS